MMTTDAGGDTDTNHQGGKRFKRLGKPLHVAKEDAKKLMKRIKEIQNSKASAAAKKALLKKVIPQWFRKGANGQEEILTDIHVEVDDGGGDDNTEQDQPAEPDEPDADAVEPDESFSGSNADIKDGNARSLRTLDNISQHHKHSQCPKDVEKLITTLVLQTTLDRLPLIKETCHRWKSPIITVVYLTEDESNNIWEQTVEDYSSHCGEHLQMIPYIAANEDERKFAYPINKMRNIGLDHVVTSHVLVLDIDLIPSNQLDTALTKAIELTISARLDDDGDKGVDPKDAIIVPAFERKSPMPCKTLEDCQHFIAGDEKFIPSSIDELTRCLLDEKCLIFQSDVNPEGHADTNSMQWLTNEACRTSLTHIECFRSLRYEPYLVIPWCELEKNGRLRLALHGPRSPYYDERFYGYGKNKIQQIAHLRERGYKFQIMPSNGFLVHHPHPESITKEIWNDRKNHELHNHMDKLYPEYLNALIHKYEDFYNETPLCKT